MKKFVIGIACLTAMAALAGATKFAQADCGIPPNCDKSCKVCSAQ